MMPNISNYLVPLGRPRGLDASLYRPSYFSVEIEAIISGALTNLDTQYAREAVVEEAVYEAMEVSWR